WHAPREFASRPVAHRTSPVAQQRCQDVVRSRFEEAAGSTSPVVARRSRTVVKGRRRKRSRNGTVHEAADHGSAASRFRPRRMPSEPPVQLLVWGERVPVIEPFSPPPLDPPPPVARSLSHPRSPPR